MYQNYPNYEEGMRLWVSHGCECPSSSDAQPVFMQYKIEYRIGGIKPIAAKLGVGVSHLSRVLRGKRAPGRALAVALKRAGIRIPSTVTIKE